MAQSVTFRFLEKDDRTVRIWDAKTRQQLAVAEGHLDPVSCVVFSPDGTQVSKLLCTSTERDAFLLI